MDNARLDVPDSWGLKDKVAIVTGGGAAGDGLGNGRAAAILLARAGTRVIVVDRDVALAKRTVEMIEAGGGQALAFQADMTRAADCAAVVEAAMDRYGRLDYLDNNVGIGSRGSVVDETEESWRRLMNVNVDTMFLAAKHAIPAMRRTGGGAIVNVSSMAGRRGLAYRIGYCSAKAGQVGMTYGMSLELAPHNIRVNAIAPGAVEGDRIDQVIAGQARVRGLPVEAMRRMLVERSPLRRMVTADDITAMAIFLVSEQSRNLSGQCIAVNAGEPAS